MANSEHLQILQQGVETWNQWRDQQREIIPDLSAVSIQGGDLRRAYLSGTDLRDAQLIQTDFRGARLIYARLSEAHLGGADLRGADLRRAYLYDWWCIYETDI